MQSSLIIPSHLLESAAEEAAKVSLRLRYIAYNRKIQTALSLGHSSITTYASRQESLEFQAAGYHVEYSDSDRYATIFFPKVELIDALPLSDEDMSKGILPATALAPLSGFALAACRLNTFLQEAIRLGHSTVHLSSFVGLIVSSMDDRQRFYDMLSSAGYSVNREQNILTLQ